MPRIRKKTSRRGSTNQREKIKHKAAETRKKRKKETKKNTQWKTKTPKDPGIPNNFPFKDQILAEIAEERRKVAEEKQKRKDEKKAAKSKTDASAGDASDDESEVHFDGISGVVSGKAGNVSQQKKIVEQEVEEEEEEAPALINSDLPNLQAVIDSADVIVQILDARDPLQYRSAHLEELSGSKKTLLVLNKIDASPREAVESWVSTLRASRPTLLFRSASSLLPSLTDAPTKGKGKARADDALGVDSVLSCLRLWSQEKPGDEPLVVAVFGVTNSGKSSFINSLLRKEVLPTYKLTSAPQDGPTTTTHPQEVTIDIDGKQIRLIDTPGLAWHSDSAESGQDAERVRARDILVRNRGRVERLKDPTPVVAEIIARADRDDLMLFYNIPAFVAGDATAFLSAVARATGLIKKGGVLDLTGASRIVLRDWSTGKFPRYTVPPSPAPAQAAPAPDAALAEVYAKDGEVLAQLQTRKERRTAAGVVKLAAGEVERRRVVLDAAWFDAPAESDDEDEGEDEGEGAASGEDASEADEDEDEDEDEEEEEEEEEAAVPPPAGKRKRAASLKTPSRPAKKVAFAAEPAGTKQARSAAGARGSKPPLNAKGPKEASKPTKAKVQKPAAKKPAAAPPKRAPNPSKAATTTTAAAGGEEAYDFKKFF